MSSYGSITVTTSPTQIIAANCDRKEIMITNNSPTILCYIGMDNLVSAANGTPFLAGQVRGHTRGFGSHLGPIWAIAVGGTADIRYWETT